MGLGVCGRGRGVWRCGVCVCVCVQYGVFVLAHVAIKNPIVGHV